MTNDLISRQDVIYAIRAFYDEYIVYDNGKSIEDLISELPSAQPEPHWISVSERLPENDDEVLMTVEFKRRRFVYTGSYSKDVDGDSHWYSLWDEFRVGGREKIIAWTPLPEPWKGEV